MRTISENTVNIDGRDETQWRKSE